MALGVSSVLPREPAVGADYYGVIGGCFDGSKLHHIFQISVDFAEFEAPDRDAPEGRSDEGLRRRCKQR